MPSPETASKADTTPTNRNYADHVPEDVLKRVNEAPGNITQLRCLIDNIECRHVVDYAHVLARADGKKNELMSSLERSWGVERGTVNSNTHRNIFRLSAKFHRLFDEGKWLLLPEMKILDEYQQHFRSGGLPIDFPAVTHDSYKYTLIPHPDMRQVAIHRRAQSIEISSASAFKTYVYPYEDFPTIVSHVHPRFVICNSGQKLKGYDKIVAFAKGDAQLGQRLTTVSRLYHHWTKAHGSHAESTQTSNPSRFQPGRGTRSVISYFQSPEQRVKGPAPSVSNPLIPVNPLVSASSVFVPQIPVNHHNPVTPPRSTKSLVYETPEERACLKTPERAKEKVVAAAGGAFCLIENVNNSNALEFAHLLARSANDTLLTNLEYWWNMKYGTLNVNTHKNITLLTKNLHRLFDANSWLLLPEDSVINQYLAAKGSRTDFPTIDSPPYKYRLLVSDDMQDYPIHRRGLPASEVDIGKGKAKNANASDSDIVSADAFTTHIYPFTEFLTITSHIHPRFVLCNSGMKLATGYLMAEYVFARLSLEPTLRNVVEIYEAWTSSQISPDFYAAALDPNIAEDDYPDGKTSSQRAPNGRKRPPRNRSPSERNPKKAKSEGNKDCAWLDDATLAELDHDPSPKKAWEDKVAWIQAWVGRVPLDAMDVDEVPMDVDHDLTDKFAGQTPDYVASVSISELSS